MSRNYMKMAFCCLIMSVILIGNTGYTPTRASGKWSLEIILDLSQKIEAGNNFLRTAILSPEGSKVGWISGQRAICTYQIEEGVKKCEPTPNGFPSRYIAWNPDGSQIATNEDPFTLGLESDIWIYDLADEDFTNCTDDELFGAGYWKMDSYNLDYLPTWGLASDSLYFFRSKPQDAE